MRKILITGWLMVAGLAQAELCVIDPTSSRYHVDTYVRNQTRCVNTQPAGSNGATIQILRATATIIAIDLITKFITHIKEENQQQEFIASIKSDTNSKIYKCEPLKVITSGQVAYIEYNKQIIKLSEMKPSVYQEKFNEGIIRVDLTQMMVYTQKWSEKTARGASCSFESKVFEG